MWNMQQLGMGITAAANELYIDWPQHIDTVTGIHIMHIVCYLLYLIFNPLNTENLQLTCPFNVLDWTKAVCKDESRTNISWVD